MARFFRSHCVDPIFPPCVDMSDFPSPLISTRSYTYLITGLYNTLVYSTVSVLFSSHVSFAAFRVQVVASVSICGQWKCNDALKPSLADGTCHVFFFVLFSSLVWPASKLAFKNPRSLLLLTSKFSTNSWIQHLHPFGACDCQPTSLFDRTFLPTVSLLKSPYSPTSH